MRYLIAVLAGALLMGACRKDKGGIRDPKEYIVRMGGLRKWTGVTKELHVYYSAPYTISDSTIVTPFEEQFAVEFRNDTISINDGPLLWYLGYDSLSDCLKFHHRGYHTWWLDAYYFVAKDSISYSGSEPELGVPCVTHSIDIHSP